MKTITVLTMLMLALLTGELFAQNEIAQALQLLRSAENDLAIAQQLNADKRFLAPEITSEFRVARIDAKTANEQAQIWAAPENAANALLGTLGAVFGIGAPTALAAWGATALAGRRKARRLLMQTTEAFTGTVAAMPPPAYFQQQDRAAKVAAGNSSHQSHTNLSPQLRESL